MSTNKKYDWAGPTLRIDIKRDPYTAVRTTPMKVLCLGMPRTGTMSTKAALHKLGFHDIYHMTRCISNPTDSLIWTSALKHKFQKGTPDELAKLHPLTREQLDGLLGDCQALLDYPATLFNAELIAAYPDAKVILTNRDPDKWHDSMMNSIVPSLRNPLMSLAAPWDPQFLAMWWPMAQAMIDWPYDGDFEKNGKEVMSREYDEVRRLVPKENLLEFEVGMGWQPLCDFLGVDVLDEPFPRVNDSASFQKNMDKLVSQAFTRAFLNLAPYIIGAVAVGFGATRYGKSAARALGMI